MKSWIEMTRSEKDEAMRKILAQGEDAAIHGGDNPYPHSSQSSQWWRRGWGNAKQGIALNKR